jgi:CRISPR-associated protein Csd1
MLLAQTARETKDIPPILAGPLLRAIVGGHSYPSGLYSAVIRRLHVDPSVNYLRCCVIKGYLNRNLNLEVSMSLDQDRVDTPYRLGRLFAALEKTQKDALGGNLNKTIRDTFYSSASATPGSVFPRLLRTYQHHLSQMEGGRRVNREKLMQAILDPLTGFPAHLSLSEQGLFAIGYYHQTNDFYTKHEETTENQAPRRIA